MKRLYSIFFLFLISATAADQPGAFEEKLQPIFEQHCVKCHGKEDKVKGKVNLAELAETKDLTDRPELLESIIIALENREMPPEDEPPLADETRNSLIKQLDAIFDEALADRAFPPTPIRRMNRFQYNNAVVDLLELERDIFQLNERLLRRYEDYFTPASKKMPSQVRVASRPLSKDIDGRRPEGFRGVAAFPQDQRAEHGFDNRADHLTMSPLLMESFLNLSQSIVESPDLMPEECESWNWLFAPPGQSVPNPVRLEAEDEKWLRPVGRAKGRIVVQGMKGWGDFWSGGQQLFWMCREPELEMTLNFKTAKPGDGIRIGYTKAPDYGTFELSLDGTVIGKPIDLFDRKVVRADDIELPIKIDPGAHQLTIRCLGKNQKSTNYLFGMDVFEVTGMPLEKKEISPPTSESDAIRTRLTKLLRRGFRRPVDPGTLQRFVQFAENNLDAGASFEETMRTVVGAVLATPDFLYFYETGDDDFELASRLALFFWGSIPDDALLDLAASGRLRDPDILGKQIDRIMNDPRTSRFCDSFPAQWLQLDRLITAVPDPKKYPYFYYNGYRVSMHMMLEPLLLFETVYLEDRSLIDLLSPDFTWESAMLKANYSGQAGGREDKILTFKRVPINDPRRGGIITNAAVMTMTSTPVRTQPITRGAWLNAVIFNDPPEPPPADVPPLPEVDEAKLETLTIRERLAEHRKREDCAGCHDRIDPLGFALENYGPTGVWRDTYENGRPVDPGGVLFKQHQFTTALEFKKFLILEKRRFIRGFVAHLLSFGLGRELGVADSPAIDQITEQAMSGENSLRTVLKNVALSEPFLHQKK